MMPGMRSQTDFRKSNMQANRSPTPDMQFQQMMGNSSAQSNGYIHPMQVTGYAQPFAPYGNEQ